MRLYLTEKPSVADALAAVLGLASRHKGYYECVNGSLVSWATGHMFESQPPEYYLNERSDGGSSEWKLEDLPIVPKRWIDRPKKESRKQLDCIGSLIKSTSASVIVHAGDPDREGQLLIDEILKHFNNQRPVLRLWVSAQDPRSLLRALDNLQDNRDFEGWADAAKARAQADWLIGINLTRAYTLLKKPPGTNKAWVVGRVQTPTLGLVVARDEAIEGFEPTLHYKVDAMVKIGEYAIKAQWKPGPGTKGLDGEGRVISHDAARLVVDRCLDAKGVVHSFSREHKRLAQPLAFTLSELTRLASSVYDYSAQTTLDACQALYEKHKLISYPRTSCGYLPEFQHEDADSVLECVAANLPELAGFIRQSDTTIRSDAWDDSRLKAHHGLLPTAVTVADMSTLSKAQGAIYELIVKRYIAQFYPSHEYWLSKAIFRLSNYDFHADGKEISQLGWKVVLNSQSGTSESQLPQLQEGTRLVCSDIQERESVTQAPNAYTEGTLIRAMESIRNAVVNPVEKETLRATDGLGTAATRALIISELKRRQYLMEDGKHIVSTPTGRLAISLYSDEIKSPSMTAINERELRLIENGAPLFDEFVNRHVRLIQEHIQALKPKVHAVDKSTDSIAVPVSQVVEVGDAHLCPDCGSKLLRRESVRVKDTYWWGCSGYPDCENAFADSSGVPCT